MVPIDSTLATGRQTQSHVSRFAGGRLQHAGLLIPDLLQQEQLKPGDIIENARIGRIEYSVQDDRNIQARIDHLASGGLLEEMAAIPEVMEDVAEAKHEQEPPLASEAKTAAVKTVVTERMSPEAPPLPPSAAQPKRQSRFVAIPFAYHR